MNAFDLILLPESEKIDVVILQDDGTKKLESMDCLATLQDDLRHPDSGFRLHVIGVAIDGGQEPEPVMVAFLHVDCNTNADESKHPWQSQFRRTEHAIVGDVIAIRIERSALELQGEEKEDNWVHEVALALQFPTKMVARCISAESWTLNLFRQ